MSLEEQIRRDLTNAMKAREELAILTLRGLVAELQNEKIKLRGALDEPKEMEIIAREKKKYEEALEAAKQAHREDLITKATTQLALTEHYLPTPLTASEFLAMAREVLAETDAKEPRDMGKVMKVIAPRIKGRFDGKRASEIIKALLAGDQPGPV